MGRGCRGGKVEAVLTCQGDIHDPGFPTKCQQIFNKLQALLDNSKFIFSSYSIFKFCNLYTKKFEYLSFTTNDFCEFQSTRT